MQNIDSVILTLTGESAFAFEFIGQFLHNYCKKSHACFCFFFICAGNNTVYYKSGEFCNSCSSLGFSCSELGERKII